MIWTRKMRKHHKFLIEMSSIIFCTNFKFKFKFLIFNFFEYDV